jgi:hypothetical protein
LAKASDKIRKIEKPDVAWAEVEAPGGIKRKDGTRIDGTILVPDGSMGYGDQESLALLTGDTVDRLSTDSSAGEKAYEVAREQADQDQNLRRAKVKQEMVMSKVAAADAFWIPELQVWGLRYLRANDDGSITESFKRLTDQEAGDMLARYEEKTGEKVG